MKKIISIIVVVMLFLTACSSQEAVKTEEELKAEIKAEMEAEAKLKEELKKEVKAEMEAENNKEDNNNSKKQIDLNNINANSKKNQNDNNVNLKIFDEVYGNDLIAAIDYFNKNSDKFSDDEKKAFAGEIIDELITKHTTLLDSMGDFTIHLKTTFDPIYPVLSDDLYDFYDFSTGEFNLNYFNEGTKSIYKALTEDKFFTLAKYVWADSAYLEDAGFKVVVKPDIYVKLIKAIENVDTEISLPDWLYNMEYNGIDSVINSNAKYPKVLMHNFEEIKELDGEDTWKTFLYLPVKFVEKKAKDDSLYDDKSVYLDGFENETLYSEDNPVDLEYAKYSLVIVPMQESVNVSKLKPRVIEVTETGKETLSYFSVIGTLYNVSMKYTKNALDDSEQPIEIFIADKIENECVMLNAEMPTDFSSIAVSGSYQYKSGLEEISFSLDDMRDPQSYKILTVEAY